MGCAPSKQNAEQDTDPDKRPLSDKEKKSPKSRKSPKKDRTLDRKEKENAKNNNAKDGPISEEIVTKAEPVTAAAPPPSEQNGGAPVDQTDAQVHRETPNTPSSSPAASPDTASPASSPIKEIAEKYGELWDLTKGMPPPTSPYDDSQIPPPKPDRLHRVTWDKRDGVHTFPRARGKPRTLSDGDEDDGARSSTLERKVSLRERTPERRKDLDLSGNIYLGKAVEPPGRGRKIDADRLEFLNSEGAAGHGDDKEADLPKLSVKERAQLYMERAKKTEESKKTTSPIRRPVKKLIEEDSADELQNLSQASQNGNVSIIEVVNKEILEDYHEVKKKTYEEIEQELRERQKKEDEERRKREEEERKRKEEEEKQRAEQEELERVRQQEEEEKRRAEEEEEEEERQRVQPAASPESEGGEVDPADKGAQLEDRFYNNKAFEKPDIDSSNPEQQEAALKIQTKYRQHHAKTVVDEKRKEQAVIRIQAGYRGWHDRKRVKEIRSQAEAKSEKEAEKAHEDDTRGDSLNYDNPEVVAAATTIQAGFKGYKARKEVQELKARKAREAEGEYVTESEDQQQVPQDNIEPDKQISEEGQAAEKIDAVAQDMQVQDEHQEEKQTTDEVPQDQQVGAEGDKQISDEVQEDKQISVEADADKADEIKEDKADEYPEEQQLAATKIQAGVRGYLARKQVKAIRDGQATSLDAPSQEVTSAEPEAQTEQTQPITDDGAQSPTEPTDTTQEPESSVQKLESDASADREEQVNHDTPRYSNTGDGDGTHIVSDVIDDDAHDNTADAKDEVTEENVDVADQGNILNGNNNIDEEEQDQTSRDHLTHTSDDLYHEEEDKATKKDIDYNDPEVEKAATKIQAGLRGMQARKKVKELKQSQQGRKGEGEDGENQEVDGEEGQKEETANSTEFNFDPNDPEINKAAAKIQAGFKGYKTRKEIGPKLKHDDSDKAAEGTSGGDEQNNVPQDGEQPAEVEEKAE